MLCPQKWRSYRDSWPQTWWRHLTRCTVTAAETGLQLVADVLYALTQWVGKSRVNSFDEVVDVALERRLNLIAGRLEVLQQLQLRYLTTTNTRRHSRNSRLTVHHHHHAIITRLAALCPGLPGWAGTRNVKPIWILLKQETVSGSGISWAVCKSSASMAWHRPTSPTTASLCSPWLVDVRCGPPTPEPRTFHGLVLPSAPELCSGWPTCMEQFAAWTANVERYCLHLRGETKDIFIFGCQCVWQLLKPRYINTHITLHYI